MGSSMKLFTFTFVLLALIELGFGGICRSPGDYQGKVVPDQFGGNRGECVSLYVCMYVCSQGEVFIR